MNALHNPILPLDQLIPDVEARVFNSPDGEKRLYLYGSNDIFGSSTWCSHRYKVFSAPLDDLSNWTDHGVSFASRKGEGYFWNGEDSVGIDWCNEQLYAPDVIRIGTLYYLITCNAGGPCLGVATSKTPEGPFSPAVRILYDDGSQTSSIDPSIYVEEDTETVYLLWGQRSSFGARGLLAAQLIPDENGIYSIVKRDTERVLFTGDNDEFGFYEGASLRKINEKYYILYPSDHGKGIHMMSYAIADSPLGPYRFGGDILDNDGCDLEPGNNHGSLCQINGQWYLFYHRGFNNSNMQRRVCVEPIFFTSDGQISPVSMTDHGFGGPLDPYQEVEAAYATHVRIDGFPAGCYLTIKNNAHILTQIQDGNCVEYRDFDFGQTHAVSCEIVFKAECNGSIDIILDNPHSLPIGTISVSAKQECCTFCAPVQGKPGIHTVYFRFHTEHAHSLGDLYTFRFLAE